MGTIERTAALLALIQGRRRVRISTLVEETGMSQTAVYRYLDALMAKWPIRRESGVVIYAGEKTSN